MEEKTKKHFFSPVPARKSVPLFLFRQLATISPRHKTGSIRPYSFASLPFDSFAFSMRLDSLYDLSIPTLARFVNTFLQKILTFFAPLFTKTPQALRQNGLMEQKGNACPGAAAGSAPISRPRRLRHKPFERSWKVPTCQTPAVCVKI
jgi:hypothetical protein